MAGGGGGEWEMGCTIAGHTVFRCLSPGHSGSGTWAGLAGVPCARCSLRRGKLDCNAAPALHCVLSAAQVSHERRKK